MADPVLLFDLDGTILESNSFVAWVDEMLRGRLTHAGMRARLAILVRCTAALADRKVLRRSHADFKRRLQRIWADATREDAESSVLGRLIDRLLKEVRPSLQPVLRDVAEGRLDAILCTAAAAEYALPFARRLGFRHALATPAAGSADSDENVGGVKRDRALAYLKSQGWATRPRILFTDHRDDLPLIRECATVFWLGPDSECAAVCGALEGVDTIAARTLSGAATHARVLDLVRRDAAAAS